MSSIGRTEMDGTYRGGDDQSGGQSGGQNGGPRDAFGPALELGGLRARLAAPDELPALLRLRARVFRGDPATPDLDALDARAWHLWLDASGAGPTRTGPAGTREAAPLATARLWLHDTPAALRQGYCARFYDLRALSELPGPTLELGRVALAPDSGPALRANLLRLLWAAIARLTLRHGAARLIGCATFPAMADETLAPALSLLAARHLGPENLRPRKQAPETRDLPISGARATPEGLRALPPLLRGYLAWGGWVSDHLVIDRDLGTSHVFTCVEVAAMPAPRRRVLARLSRGETTGRAGRQP